MGRPARNCPFPRLPVTDFEKNLKNHLKKLKVMLF